MPKLVLPSLLIAFALATGCGGDDNGKNTDTDGGGSGSKGGNDSGKGGGTSGKDGGDDKDGGAGTSGDDKDGGGSGNGSDGGGSGSGNDKDGSVIEDASPSIDANQFEFDATFASCTTLEAGDNAVTETQKNTTFPVPDGGEIKNGTYKLTHFDVYSPGTAGATVRKWRMKVEDNKLTIVALDGTERRDNVGTFTTADKLITFLVTCPEELTLPLPYTVSGDDIWIINSNNHSVMVLSKEP